MMSNKLKILTNDNFQSTISDTKLTLVEFGATWCSPCRALHPIINEIANEIGDKVNICSADVDKCEREAGNYNIMSVPTILIFRDGNVLERFTGFKPKSDIIEIIKKHK
ncbi:MAG: thioredoxin family protein [Christensenellaceae bacterium]|nr:thioredoxin family protein [Christensenellaceae bacterium]